VDHFQGAIPVALKATYNAMLRGKA